MFPSPTYPPPPPGIATQQEEPEPGGGVFMQPGQQGQPPGQTPGGPMAMLKQKLAELESWAGETMMIAKQANPALTAFLGPIAQAGIEMRKAIEEMEQRSGMAKGSPQVPARPPQNPAAGPPNPNVL